MRSIVRGPPDTVTGSGGSRVRSATEPVFAGPNVADSLNAPQSAAPGSAAPLGRRAHLSANASPTHRSEQVVTGAPTIAAQASSGEGRATVASLVGRGGVAYP